MKRLVPLLFALIALTAGCNTTGCLDNQNSIPLAGFYDSGTGAEVALNIVQIHGVGAPGDSILVAGGTSAKQVYLPMRSTMPSTTWCFHYTQMGIDYDDFNDTIAFDYTSTPYFASEECGAIYHYHIDKCRYTTHLIDSVVIADSLITNVDQVRIKIYFRIASAGDDQNQNMAMDDDGQNQSI